MVSSQNPQEGRPSASWEGGLVPMPKKKEVLPMLAKGGISQPEVAVAFRVSERDVSACAGEPASGSSPSTTSARRVRLTSRGCRHRSGCVLSQVLLSEESAAFFRVSLRRFFGFRRGPPSFMACRARETPRACGWARRTRRARRGARRCPRSRRRAGRATQPRGTAPSAP